MLNLVIQIFTIFKLPFSASFYTKLLGTVYFNFRGKILPDFKK